MIGCDKYFDFVGYGGRNEGGVCCLLESEDVFIFFYEIESWDLFLNDSPRKRSCICRMLGSEYKQCLKKSINEARSEIHIPWKSRSNKPGWSYI